jgi:hypothetical protein
VALLGRSRASLLACALAAAGGMAARAEGAPTNLLYIGEGGIALADGNEQGRDWRNFSINLVDGSNQYGWTSAPGTRFPHTLVFELERRSVIHRVALDSSFAPVVGYDGRRSEPPAGGPARRFRLWGVGPAGAGLAGAAQPVLLLEGELPRSSRAEYALAAPATVEALRLEILDNWGDEARTHLAEFEAIGSKVEGAPVNASGIDGLYAHEYGPIALRRDGDKVSGCYLNGAGALEGLVSGRVMRLAFLEPANGRMGAVTFVAAHDQLYGFWFNPLDAMGSPWNAPKVAGLVGDLGKCAWLRPSPGAQAPGEGSSR